MHDLPQKLQAALGSDYELEARVGQGGMSTVYRARDLRHDRAVAVKAMTPALAATIEQERFFREIRLVAGLQHPLILPLLDSGEADGVPYYVMPFVEGESLTERLARDGQLPLPEALKIAGDALEALAYAHERGVVHRDIKPGNLMLTSGRAMLADFGIAKALEEAGGELTATGLAVGTPYYMSPEQVTGEGVIDGRADLYSVACMLFEMLAGDRAFGSGPAQAILARHLTMDPPDLLEVRSDVPPGVADAIRRAMAKVPDDRPPTAAAFADDLGIAELVTGSSPTRAALAAAHDRRRLLTSPGFIAVLVAAALGGAVIATTLFRGREVAGFGDDPRRSFVVAAFRSGAQSETETDLVQDAAYELTRQLNGWGEARATPQLALGGLKFDLGLDDGVLSRLPDGIALARSAGVGTLVALTVSTRGDTAYIDATPYDVSTGDALRAFQNSGSLADPFDLVAPVANELLGLGGAPAEIETLRRQSNDLEAVQRFRAGVRDLGRWELAGAAANFVAAIQRDSTFALSHHFLGLTRYWEGARGSASEALAASISQSSGAALRYSNGLPRRDSSHIRAFWDFQRGDFESARESYHGLIDRDSTDVYAWLLMGSLEFEDQWTRQDSDGALRPRTDSNLALRAFSETVRLAPDFHLGYGQLTDLLDLVTGTAYDGRCQVFERPGGVPLGLFAQRQPGAGVTFCPFVSDTVAWLTREEFARVSGDAVLAGADDLMGLGLARLRRWASYAPDQARPEEELLAWSLQWRGRLVRSDGLLERVDSLTEVALGHAERAASLRSDTVPADLATIAVLNLALENRGLALERADQAVDRAGSNLRFLPRAVANVYLDRGDASSAIRILRPAWEQVRISAEGPSGEDLSYVGVEPMLAELMVYGAVGWAGPPVEDLLNDIRVRWTEFHGEEGARALGKAAMNSFLAPVLTGNPAALRDWLEGMEDLSPRWRAQQLRESDPAAARVQLELSLGELRDGPRVATEFYERAILAQRLDLDSLSIALFEEAREIPRSIGDFSPAWGLTRLADLYEARSLETLGRPREALARYRAFSDAWRDADSRLEPLVREAAAAIARIEGGAADG